MTPANLNPRMTDEEVKEIFRRVIERQPVTDVTTENFLHTFGNALLWASRRDFMILRGTALLFIAKYHLAAESGAGGKFDKRRSA